MTTAGVLFVCGVTFLAVVANLVAVVAGRRRGRRDDLMALADSLGEHLRGKCGEVYRSMAVDHAWHVCDLPTGHIPPYPFAFRAAELITDSHFCRCAVGWVTPAADAQQIALLDRMLGADAHEPDRRTS